MSQSQPRTNGHGRRTLAHIQATLRLMADVVRELIYLSAGTAAIVAGLACDSSWAVGIGIALLIITITQLQVVSSRDDKGVLNIRLICPT
jgi:hypothetical protein